jgi:ankyrin repeat protein
VSGGDWKELYAAARTGDLDLLKYHVEHGVDPDYVHPEFMSTPLVAAILAGHRAAAQYLLDHGASPDLESDLDGVTPRVAAQQTGMPLRLDDAGT